MIKVVRLTKKTGDVSGDGVDQRLKLGLRVVVELSEVGIKAGELQFT